MRNKKLFNLSAIILGIVTLWSCSKVQATESVFSDTMPTRSRAQAYASNTFNLTTLGISKNRESGNWYVWDPKTDAFQDGKVIPDENDNVQAKKVWKIANIDSSNNRDYSDLYYCLNAEIGFGIINGEMAERATDDYLDNFDMKNSSYIDNIIDLSRGSLETNYNKVLWILDNSYIPTREENYQKTLEYIKLMQDSDIEIATDERLNLTEDDIEVVQQMAIWYFTNSDNNNYNNENLPSLYLNGDQLSSIYLYTTEYGEQITGKIRQDKAEKLYKYFIENAFAEYSGIEKKLEIVNSNVEVTDKEEYYIVGPIEIEKTSNVILDKIIVKINDNELSSEKYSVVSLEDTNSIITDYSNLNKFFIKVDKTEISNKSNIKVCVVGNYSERKLTFMTDSNDAENTQPVVLIKTVSNPISDEISTLYEITGKYNVVIRKVDESGNKLEGSKFKVSGIEYDLPTGEVIIYENQQITSENPISFTYIIEETVVPVGYNGIESTEVNIEAKVQKVNNNYKLVRATLVDSEGNNITDENISIKLEGDSIVIEVKNTSIEKEFDLSLRKFITQINDQTYLREPKVDTSKLGTVVDGKTVTTATYKHTKQPIIVQKGDIVTYTIRVYNEGEIDGYVEIITDHLPKNLKPIIEGVEGIDSEKYKEEIEFNSNWLWMYSNEGNIVSTTITSKGNVETYSILTEKEEVTDTKLNAYEEGSNVLDYIDVQIKCLVTDSAVDGEYLTNIAEISKMCDVNGVEVEADIDSTKANADHSNLENYKNEQAISSDTNSYVEGQEDDDDFEKLWVKEFDLSLRKFITKVNETSYSRVPKVDTSKLGTEVNGKTLTTAIYNHSKEPVIVETGDLVTYKIRIYNEGSLAGFANEITDDIPKGLEFLPNSSVNVSYRWEMLDSEGNKTEDVSKAVMIVTDYLSDIDKNNIINAVSEQDGVKTLNYKDVEVQFKVVAKAEKLKDNIIINEAQISSDSDRDIDSIPNRNEKYDYTKGNNEDDIDYEPIKLQYFDLALRKFVTKVNTTDYNNRYPEVVYNEDGSITYKQTKDPVLVTTGDTVIYTIRVYNQGEKPGTATQIKDNLPEGLEFLPENEINKIYGWKLIDEVGNETEDLSKAKKVATNILENETIDGIIIKDGQKILGFKDIQIAFKVIEEETSNKILVNTAEIAKDSDDDIDSTPDNEVETEDDLDKEYVKVQYFDLALKKWVTSTQVTYNGKTTTTKTGFTEDSEGIAKVDLVASKMKKTTVKFIYSIKVINEGELPGYAYEIKDYIPKGLKFVQEDNKDWKEVEDGVVVTDKLKDTLLNPGESATVEITLTWKNSTTNLALKTNYAEISEDSADDIDSTPDNFNKKEDDIDDAQVILSIKTAGVTTYVSLVLIAVGILAIGIFLIKKYVIR